MLTTSSDHRIYPKVSYSSNDSNTVVQKITIGKLASVGILQGGNPINSALAGDSVACTTWHVMLLRLYRKNGGRPIKRLSVNTLAILVERPCDISTHGVVTVGYKKFDICSNNQYNVDSINQKGYVYGFPTSARTYRSTLYCQSQTC